MRIRFIFSAFWLVVICCSLAVEGQDAVKVNASLNEIKKNIMSPYTAEFLVVNDNTLHDGSIQSSAYIEVLARDAMGRTSRIFTNYNSMVLNTTSSVYVYDPENGNTATWTIAKPLSKIQASHRVIVTKSHDILAVHTYCTGYSGAQSTTYDEQSKVEIDAMGNKINPVLANLRDWMRNNKFSAPSISSVNEKKPSTNVHLDLGNQRMNGIETHGYRNESSDDTYDEAWVSKEPGIMLQIYEIHKTPVHQYTRQLLSLTEGEPKADLFQPPADYVVVEKFMPLQCSNVTNVMVHPRAAQK